MKSLIYIVLLMGLLLSISSCKIVKKPTVERIQDITVVSINPDKSAVNVSLIVHNPNGFKMKLNKLSLDLLNKDRGKVGMAALSKDVEIPKKASVNLDFMVELDTRPVVKMVSSLDQKVQFFVVGKGHGKALGMGREFEFDEPFELDLKEHLQSLLTRFSASGQSLFKVQRTSVEKVGLSETELQVSFIVLNPYGFSFNLQGFPAEIYINNKLVGKGNLQNQMKFDESIYSKDGVMVFKLSNFKSVFGAVSGVFKGEVAYTVKGKVMVNALGMDIVRPYDYKGSIPLSLWELLIKP